MYGTLMRCRPLPGQEATILERSRQELERQTIDGLIGEYVLVSEQHPGEVAVLVLFASQESYWRNAQSPEQHARYQELRALLAADPEWEDGEIIELRPATVPI